MFDDLVFRLKLSPSCRFLLEQASRFKQARDETIAFSKVCSGNESTLGFLAPSLFTVKFLLLPWILIGSLVLLGGFTPRFLRCVAAQSLTLAKQSTPPTAARVSSPHGVIVAAQLVTPSSIKEWRDKSYRVALILTDAEHPEIEIAAANQIVAAGLTLDYFLEIGRCPELAAAHPEWMASLQGHPEWRNIFPNVAEPTPRQVIKNSPWVPIFYQEAFLAHVDRAEKLLKDKPAASRIWLNDLQAGPSACGCGHPLCRWTADYGPIKTATTTGPDAAAKFVKAIKTTIQQQGQVSEIIPIFVGECEADDKHDVCCGVDCFEGACWIEFTRQLDEAARVCPTLGIACFYRAFDRDLKRYGPTAGWVSFSIKSFAAMPPQRNGVGVAANRLLAILQGWEVNEAQVAAQIQQAEQAGVQGWMIALTPIEQAWQPVLFDLPPNYRPPATKDSTPAANQHDHRQD